MKYCNSIGQSLPLCRENRKMTMASSTRKRKRPTEESVRKNVSFMSYTYRVYKSTIDLQMERLHVCRAQSMSLSVCSYQFLELRDTGVPDTGPKRPKDKRTIALTPATVTDSSTVSTASQVSREEASVAGGAGRRQSRGRGRRRESAGRRRSQGEKTPRTQLRSDIRDLIKSEICLNPGLGVNQHLADTCSVCAVHTCTACLVGRALVMKARDCRFKSRSGRFSFSLP